MSIYLRQRPRNILGVLEVVVSPPSSPRRFGSFLEHEFRLSARRKKTKKLATKLPNILRLQKEEAQKETKTEISTVLR